MIFVVIPFILLSVFLHQKYLVIKAISCISDNNSDCPNQVNSILSKYNNQSIISLRLSKIANEIRETGIVDSVSINPVLPSKLVVSLKTPREIFGLNLVVTQEQPYFTSLDSSTSAYLRPTIEIDQFMATVSGQFYSLYPSGTLVATSNPSTIVYIAPQLPNRQTGRQIYLWLQALATQTSKLDNIYIVREFLLTSLSAGYDCLLPLNEEPSAKLLALQQITSLSTINTIRIIDFRFKHPILK